MSGNQQNPPPTTPAHAETGSAMTRLLDRPAVPLTIAEATKSASAARAHRREEQQNLLVVRCGREWFAFPAASVIHVSKSTAVHALPHRSRRGFRGLTAIAGAIVPAIDLHALLDLPEAEPTRARNPRMVQVGEAHASWAFEADEVPGVYAVPALVVKALPLTVEYAPNRISCGLVATPHGSASLIDPARMIAEFTKALG